MKKALSVLLAALLIFGSLTLTSCGENTKGMKFYTVKEIRNAEDGDLFAIRLNLSYFNTSLRKSGYGVTPEDYKVELDDDDYICVLTDEASGDITVPSEYKGQSVTLVTCGVDAAMDSLPLNDVTSMTVSDGVDYIEALFCYGGASLNSVSLPSGISVYSCFKKCEGLEDISISGGGTIYNSFNECPALTSAAISETEMIDASFHDCEKLKEISLSDDDTITDSFRMCTALESAELNGIKSVSASLYNCNVLKSADLSKVDDISDSLNACTQLESVDLAGMETINECFNSNENLKDAKIPDATSIVDSFGNTQLESVSLPKATSVQGSFNNSNKLQTITGADQITTIEDSFNNCSALKTLPKLDKLETVSESFCSCGALTDTEFAKTAEKVTSSFGECPALEKVMFDAIIEIDESFCDCEGLKDVYVHSRSDINLDINKSFNNLKQLKKAKLDGMVYSCIDSFCNCPILKTVDLKYHLEEIDGSFKNCPNLVTEIITGDEYAKRQQEEQERKRKEELDNEPYGPGTSALELSADDDLSACFRLLRMNGSEEFMVFLEPGESTTEYFPSGRYTLKVAEGEKWISDKEAFGSKGHYTTTDIYTFEADYVYTITTGDHGDFRSDSASGFVG